ncbi:MAG: hypothetical protein ACRD9S_24085, partial [Pyrinomonadaceae bacterium]
LTASRLRRHRQLRRQIHITLLKFHAGKPRFGPLTTFWINERSRVCSASLNERLEEADVVWIYTQDPLTEELHERLLKAIDKTQPGARIINAGLELKSPTGGRSTSLSMRECCISYRVNRFRAIPTSCVILKRTTKNADCQNSSRAAR